MPKTIRLTITWQNQSPAELLEQVGGWLEAQGEIEQALIYYEAALQVDPTFSLASYRAGRIALRRQDYIRAVKFLEHAVRLTPDHAPTYYLLSLAYYKVGEVQRAIESAEIALQNNPLHVGAFLQKLRCLALLKKWEEIEKICQDLPYQFSQITEIYLWQTLALIHLQKKEKAKNLYSKLSLKIRKRYPEIIKQIELNLGLNPEFLE